MESLKSPSFFVPLRYLVSALFFVQIKVCTGDCYDHETCFPTTAETWFIWILIVFLVMLALCCIGCWRLTCNKMRIKSRRAPEATSQSHVVSANLENQLATVSTGGQEQGPIVGVPPGSPTVLRVPSGPDPPPYEALSSGRVSIPSSIFAVSPRENAQSQDRNFFIIQSYNHNTHYPHRHSVSGDFASSPRRLQRISWDSSVSNSVFQAGVSECTPQPLGIRRFSRGESAGRSDPYGEPPPTYTVAMRQHRVASPGEVALFTDGIYSEIV